MALNREPGQQTDERQLELESLIEPQDPREGAPELVDGQPQAPALEAPAPRGETDSERLSKALQTIEGLTKQVHDLQGRQPQVVYQDRPASGREALPEMIEVLPGRMIPKDPTQRAIKLGAQDLIRMGWNEDPAGALNALANAFFHHIAEVVPTITLHQLDQQGRVYNAGQNRQNAFYTEFPDLRDFSDLAQIVENQAMQELPMGNMTQGDWNREVGTRGRQRIAPMRGVSLEQYTASLGGLPNGAAPRRRAVTAPPARGARQAPANDQQREIDDLLEGRL